MTKRTLKNLLLTLPVVLVVSCGPSVKVNADYDRHTDFTSYKTFSMFYLTTNKNVNELNAERIWNSIRYEMTRKGYVESDENPDLLVNASSALKNKQYLSASSSITGTGVRPYALGAGAGIASANTTIQAYNTKDGSLMLEVVDRKENRLVFQGTATAEIEKQPKNPDEAIQKAVAKILSSLPEGGGFIK